MKKKTSVIAIGSFLACSAMAVAFAASTNGFKLFERTKGSEGDYTITINPEDITTSTTSTSGQVVVKTDQLKNDVKIDFGNVKKDGDNLVVLEGGFIANNYESQIRSIKTLTVFGDYDDVFDYSFGYQASGTTIDYGEVNYDWANGTDIDLSSYVPNYFKLEYRAVDVRITKIVIEYDKDCVVGVNPTVIKDGLKYRKVGNDHAILVGYGGTPFADVVVADTVEGLPVTEVANNAFYYNTTIKSIVLGANVTKIGEYAFTYASNLESVTGFDQLEEIGGYAFNGAGSLTGDVVFSSALTNIGSAAFMYANITSVTFADTGNPYVPDGAFRSCDELVSVHVGSEMTQFYDDFYTDDKLATITVGAGNTKYSAVENVLFNNADKLVACIAANRPQTSFTVPTGYELKGYCAYGNNTLETLTLNDTVRKIPDYSFCYCTNLRTINFGSYYGLTIGYAFANCTALETLTIPGSVATIEQHTFEGCTSLHTLVIEEGCGEIQREAFKDCTSLVNVALPSSLTNIGTEGGWTGSVDVFEGCTSLTKICVNLTSGTYEGPNVVSGWDGGRDLVYYSSEANFDGEHWRMVDGTPRIWGKVNVTFKVYRTDIGMGWAIYFLGSFNGWTANEDSRGSYVSDHWELTIELVSYENYEFKGVVAEWDNPTNLTYEAGDNHSYAPEDSAFEYIINWQY